jgi:hypothetical protein
MGLEDPVAGPLEDNKKILKIVSSIRTSQIWSQDVRAHLKAVGLAWFNAYRKNYSKLGSLEALSTLDSKYKALVSSADGAPRKKKTYTQLKIIQKALSDLRKQLLDASILTISTPDVVPSFNKLAPDPFMQQVLEARWNECTSCIAANAPVAAIVMMGGLLESLFLARVNRESDKRPIFQARSAPKNKSRQTLPLKEWTLRDYIDVAHELNWISESAHGVSEVLRDYRNYIHPYKQVSLGKILTTEDAKILWEVFKSISKQLL